MALIECAACGYLISEKASVCPNCGHPVDWEELNQIAEQKKKKEKMQFNCLMWFFLFFIIIMFVIFYQLWTSYIEFYGHPPF